MDLFLILETFGLPVLIVIVIGGVLVKSFKSQMDFIQKDLTSEIDKLRDIIIELISQSKKSQLSTAELKGGLTKMVKIFTDLIKHINKEK